MAEILCPHCLNLHPAEAAFCPLTGKAIAMPENRPDAQERFCQKCHTPLQPGWMACPACGYVVPTRNESPAPAAYPPANDYQPVSRQPAYPTAQNQSGGSGRKWLVCGSLGLFGAIAFLVIACLAVVALLGLSENNRTAKMLPAEDTQVLVTFSPTLLQLPSLIYSDRLEKSLGIFGAVPGASDLASLTQESIFQDLEIDPRTDILPWIGNEISMAVLGGSQFSNTDSQVAAVGYPGASRRQMGEGVLITAATRSKSGSDAFLNRLYRQLREKGADIQTYEYGNVEITEVNEPGSFVALYIATHRGLLMFSPMQGVIETAIDSSGKPRASLYQDEGYQQMLKQLPGNRLGMMYLDLETMGLGGSFSSDLEDMLIGPVRAIGGSFSLESSGLRFDYLVKYEASGMSEAQLKMLQTSATRNQLLDTLPEDSIFYLSGQDMSLSAQVFLGLYAGGLSDMETIYDEFRRTYGVDIQEDFLDHLRGEYSVAFVPGGGEDENYLMGFVFSAQMDDKAAVQNTIETLMRAIANDTGSSYYSDESGGNLVIGIRDSGAEQAIGFVLDGDVLHLAISGSVIDRLTAGGGASLSGNEVFKQALRALPSKERQYIVIDVGGVVSYFTSMMSADEVREFNAQYGEYIQDLKSISMSIGQMDSTGIIHGQLQINTR